MVFFTGRKDGKIPAGTGASPVPYPPSPMCLSFGSLLQNKQILTLLWVDGLPQFWQPKRFFKAQRRDREKSTNSSDLNFPWRIAVEFKEPEIGNQTWTFLLISTEKPKYWL